MINIRIKKAPVMAGDQYNHSLFTGGPYDLISSSRSSNFLPQLPAVSRHEANIEAEKNETVMGDFDNDGIAEHFKIGGNKHYEGGTPLSVPDGSFIFSDDRRLKLKGAILDHFGKGKNNKKKYTPASLAKQYDINSYKEVLEDPQADRLAKATASLMIANNRSKLENLSLLQEAMKGFPNGVPSFHSEKMPQEPGTQFKGGGIVNYPEIPEFPVDPHKGDKNQPRNYQRKQLKLNKGFNQYNTSWLSQFGYPNNPQGLDQAILDAGYTGNLNDARKIQQFLIRENLKRNNTGVFDDLMRQYGMTNQGIQSGQAEANKVPGYDQRSLENIFADNIFGVRSGLMLKSLLQRPLKPTPVTIPLAQIPLKKPTVEIPLVPKSFESDAPSPAFQKRKPTNEDWFTQDIINTGAALRNRMNIRKYPPVYNELNSVLPIPTFFDPSRQVAALQEQGAQAMNSTALLAGTPQARATLSQYQGQLGSQIAGVLGQVNNLNVGVANEFEAKGTDLLNNFGLQKNANRKQYNDEWAIMNQQYDNSVKQAEESVRQNIISGISNKEKASRLNLIAQQFRFDPQDGQFYFTKGKDLPLSPSGPTGQGSSIEAYDQYYKQAKAKGYADEKAHDYASKMVFGNKSKFSADSDGDSHMTTSTYGTSPMAAQLLNLYTPQFNQ